MKRLSIQWRVTLWFTLLMTLLAAVGLAFLFFVGGQSALAATQNRMAEMAETARSEIGLDSSGFVFDSDLEYFRDGVYLSVYDAAGLPLYGAVPRLFDNTVVFADSQLRELTDTGGRWYVYDISFAVDESQVWVRTVAAVDEVGSTITQLLRLALVVLPFFCGAGRGGRLLADAPGLFAGAAHHPHRAGDPPGGRSVPPHRPGPRPRRDPHPGQRV